MAWEMLCLREFPAGGWHIDGTWETDTFEQLGMHLLVIGLLTDIEPGYGGTIFALGSHKTCARSIADLRTNLSRVELFKTLLHEPIGNFHEVVGCAGDVVLAPPFLLHTTGFNRRGRPRIMSAARFRALEPQRRVHVARECSVFERSIQQALGDLPVTPAGAALCRPMLD